MCVFKCISGSIFFCSPSFFLRSFHCYVAEERTVLKAIYLVMQVELCRLFYLKHSFLIYNNPVFRMKGYQDIMSYILLLVFTLC